MEGQGSGPLDTIESDPSGSDAEVLVADLLTRCTFPSAGTEVTCAVSGGADSTALVVLAAAAGCRVIVVHVDHGSRPGSEIEADVVASTAAALGADFRAERVQVEPGPNFEARARAARYGVLPADVLTGHTLDDQAETVVLQLLRGTGVDGLAAMSPRGHPLLGLRRYETVRLCELLGLDLVDDPSNADPRYRRNRVRAEVLPLLDDVAERDVAPLLARLAAHARDLREHLHRQASSLDVHDARSLAAADPLLAAVAVRSWLRSCSPEGHPPGQDAVARVMAVARGEAVATEVGAGWSVRRSGGRLALNR